MMHAVKSRSSKMRGVNGQQEVCILPKTPHAFDWSSDRSDVNQQLRRQQTPNPIPHPC